MIERLRFFGIVLLVSACAVITIVRLQLLYNYWVMQ